MAKGRDLVFLAPLVFYGVAIRSRTLTSRAPVVLQLPNSTKCRRNVNHQGSGE